MAKINQCHFELIDHPPYSSDQVPSDYLLFPKLKVWLREQRFSSNEVIQSVNAYFVEQDAIYYLDGLKWLENRWTKCINVKGSFYVRLKTFQPTMLRCHVE